MLYKGADSRVFRRRALFSPGGEAGPGDAVQNCEVPRASRLRRVRGEIGQRDSASPHAVALEKGADKSVPPLIGGGVLRQPVRFMHIGNHTRYTFFQRSFLQDSLDDSDIAPLQREYIATESMFAWYLLHRSPFQDAAGSERKMERATPHGAFLFLLYNFMPPFVTGCRFPGKGLWRRSVPRPEFVAQTPARVDSHTNVMETKCLHFATLYGQI